MAYSIIIYPCPVITATVKPRRLSPNKGEVTLLSACVGESLWWHMYLYSKSHKSVRQAYQLSVKTNYRNVYAFIHIAIFKNNNNTFHKRFWFFFYILASYLINICYQINRKCFQTNTTLRWFYEISSKGCKVNNAAFINRKTLSVYVSCITAINIP